MAKAVELRNEAFMVLPACHFPSQERSFPLLYVPVFLGWDNRHNTIIFHPPPIVSSIGEEEFLNQRNDGEGI